MTQERAFPLRDRGEERELMLARFRLGLRAQVDAAGQPLFTEDDVAKATQQKSRWWSQADGVDIALLGVQHRAVALVDQVRPATSSTGGLQELHAKVWEVPRLQATGATISATAKASAGSSFPGSTTVPDAAAAYATDPAGLRYQVLYSVVTPANGVAGSDASNPLVLVGVDVGEQTNLPAGTKLRWAALQPLSAEPEFTTSDAGTGGTDEENDLDHGRRIEADIQHKPGAGNNAQFRKWAREASNAVEDAFVHANAFDNGSVLLTVTQKRGAAIGPLARLPALGTLQAVKAAVVSPGSPNTPGSPLVVVVPPVAVPSDLVLSLALPRARSSGWADSDPWPLSGGGVGSVITAAADHQHFTISATTAPPVDAPALMLWDEDSSRFVSLSVLSVVAGGVGLYNVTLTVPSTVSPTVGMRVAPDTRRRAILSATLQAYFDGLGPGEVVDLATDPRGYRAWRFPEPTEEWPQRAGASVLADVQEALGGSLSSSTLDAISATAPPVPSNVIDGPSLLVLGKLGVYPL